MTTPKDVLDRARSQLGVHEDPFGSNRTKYSEWYGIIGPWCAMFVSWCFFNEGLPLPASTSKGFSYTPSGAAWFQHLGRWTTKPREGAVVFFDFPGDNVDRISHVGIVEKVNSDGTVTCLEGNTNDAAGRTGGMVMRHVRRTGIVGYGLPTYGGAAGEPDKTKKDNVLSEGDTGKSVANWQRNLNEATGARLEVDGEFGPATTKSTIQFQEHNGLTADGEVGPKTRAKMKEVLGEQQPPAPIVSVPPFPGRLLKQGVQGADVRQWQIQAAKLGLTVNADGVFGPETDKACRDLQTQKQLKVDGVVGPDTWTATFTPVA